MNLAALLGTLCAQAGVTAGVTAAAGVVSTFLALELGLKELAARIGDTGVGLTLVGHDVVAFVARLAEKHGPIVEAASLARCGLELALEKAPGTLEELAGGQSPPGGPVATAQRTSGLWQVSKATDNPATLPGRKHSQNKQSCHLRGPGKAHTGCT